MRLKPEEEVVLLCVQAEWSATDEDRLRSLIGLDLDWNAVWAAAAAQGVRPLVASALLDPALGPLVPEECRRDARRARAGFALQARSLQAELRQLGVALRRDGVSAIPLKGVSLAERTYGDATRRETGDIDLLVPEEQVGSARAALYHANYAQLNDADSDASYHQFHESPFVRSGPVNAFVVELHWKLSDPRFVTIDHDALWRRARCRGAGDGEFLQLPTEETLLFLALHMFKHQAGLLRLLLDIDRLIRCEGHSLDWALTLGLAERWGVCAPLYFALDYAHQLLDTPVPMDILAHLRPAPWKRHLIDRLVGPRVTFRPGAAPYLGYSRALFAYALMLQSWRQVLEAYILFIYPWPPTRRAGGIGGVADLVQRVASGVAKTVMVLAGALAGA